MLSKKTILTLKVWFAFSLCVREILLYCSISIQNRVRPCKPDESLTKNVAYLTCSFNRNVVEKFNKTTMHETCSPRSKYHYTKNEVSHQEFVLYDQIRRKLRIWFHLLKKSLMENFIFSVVYLFRVHKGNTVTSWRFSFFVVRGTLTLLSLSERLIVSIQKYVSEIY